MFHVEHELVWRWILGIKGEWTDFAFEELRSFHCPILQIKEFHVEQMRTDLGFGDLCWFGKTLYMKE
jgi:hypothetical protein